MISFISKCNMKKQVRCHLLNKEDIKTSAILVFWKITKREFKVCMNHMPRNWPSSLITSSVDVLPLELVSTFDFADEFEGDLTLGGLPVSAAGSSEVFLLRRVNKFLSASSAWIKAETHSFSDLKKRGVMKVILITLARNTGLVLLPSTPVWKVACFLSRHLCELRFA